MAHSTDVLTHSRLHGGAMAEPDAEAIVGRDAVTLYVRTYNTILRTSGEVRVRAFEAAHQGVGSSLHPRAGSDRPDSGAFIYAIQRLPACMVQIDRVILGQLPEQFGTVIPGGVDGWHKVTAPGRRREWRWDGAATLAVSIASPSDLDDMIPTLVAYQIEWNKLHRAIRSRSELAARLERASQSSGAWVGEVGRELGLAEEDWVRLRHIWGPDLLAVLRAIAASQKDVRLQMLGGTHVGYSKLVDRWWGPIGRYLAEHGLANRPTYFVSSNPHSIVNLVSGYVRRRADVLWRFLDAATDGDANAEIAALRSARGWSNPENVLYYASRLWHATNQEAPVKDERATEEAERGIVTIPSVAGFDVCAQVVDLARVRVEDIDPRLAELADVVERTDAVILNVDYPLGMAAYYIGRQVTEWVGNLRGMYILGKAATLNGAVGDVMIADVVYDEHTGNVYSLPNAFRYADVAPWLERASALDKQKAVTVRGTFLQNREYLEFFYREAYTVVEMEAGPYLSAVYEATYPDRHPTDEAVHFRDLPFDVGLVHYASDTPYTRARTLGSRRLSFEGIDSTYGSTVAILRRILSLERARLGGSDEDGRSDGHA
ncbi:MAG: hypothetical protein M3O34_16870 [Chloroflexota bacterium]|nr:hypothetical protein [Chloroflexota bacterium]